MWGKGYKEEEGGKDIRKGMEERIQGGGWRKG
jgi:hypothetical protein